MSVIAAVQTVTIAGRGSANLAFDFRVPAVLPGQYRLLADIDATDVLAEVNETNNLAVGPELDVF